jgi:hypothetical protein
MTKEYDIVFERVLLPIVNLFIFNNREAKASESRFYRDENERKYYVILLYF